MRARIGLGHQKLIYRAKIQIKDLFSLQNASSTGQASEMQELAFADSVKGRLYITLRPLISLRTVFLCCDECHLSNRLLKKRYALIFTRELAVGQKESTRFGFFPLSHSLTLRCDPRGKFRYYRACIAAAKKNYEKFQYGIDR